MRVVGYLLVGLFFYSCTALETRLEPPVAHELQKMSFQIPMKEFDDSAYPDNPDIGYRHLNYGEFSHDSVHIVQVSDTTFQLRLTSGNARSAEIVFPAVELLAMMPKVPSWIKQNDYLTQIGIINQEWNRHQVRFDRADGFFQVKSGDTSSFEYQNITRIDIARNCLNSGLWEVIAYAKQGDSSEPYYHGWFDFPLDIYADLFGAVNRGMEFQHYEHHLVKWKDPKSEPFDFSVLRERGEEVQLETQNCNNSLYQEKGSVLQKKKNIIYPYGAKRIQDYLTDSTQFSTFSPPGCYRTDDPRSTQLGLFHTFLGANVYQINHSAIQNEDLIEIELQFTNSDRTKETTLIFGGLDLDKFSYLPDSMHHQGYKYPMGLSNHSFYETYQTAISNDVENNPYYGVIIDQDGNWLDSHAVGVDGPQFFWDAGQDHVLQLHILSFERHSYVGHFTFDFNE